MPGSVPLHDATLARLAVSYPLIGIALLHHRTQRGEPLQFADRPALVEPYVDFPRIDGADVVKAPQLNWTELMLQLMVYETGWRGRIVAYVMPTMDSRNRMVQARVNPFLLDVPAYRQRLPGADVEDLRTGEAGNLRLKRIGSGLVLFLGAKVDADFVELSCDTMIIDEHDLCEEASAENLAKGRDRLLESKEPRLFRLGNPEVPGGGIDRLYEEGDRRLYTWRCGACGERQALDWLEHVVDLSEGGAGRIRDDVARRDPAAPIRPVCARCRRPFERVAAGSCWVARNPSRPRRSYRMARWDRISEPLRRLHDAWLAAQTSTTAQRLWWRAAAGRAWEQHGNAVTREALRDASVLPAMRHDGASEGTAMTAGIDVGALFNVTISETLRGPAGRSLRAARWVGAVSSWEGVRDLLVRYRVAQAVVDEGPELHGAGQLRDWGAGRGINVWLCRFHPQPITTGEPLGMRRDIASHKVTVDRTQAMDAAADGIALGAALGRAMRERGWPDAPVGWDALPDPGADGARVWSSDVDCALGFLDQMTEPKRVLRNGKFEWTKTAVPDHYRLADTYDLVAWHLSALVGRFW